MNSRLFFSYTVSALTCVSIALNLALSSTLIKIMFQNEKEKKVEISTGGSVKHIIINDLKLLDSFFAKTMEELVLDLDDKTSVEKGLRKCDLAIGVLRDKFFCDIEKALSYSNIDVASIKINGGQRIKIFLGLSLEQIDLIKNYLRSEVYPYNTQGLFEKIKNNKKSSKNLNDVFKSTILFINLKRIVSQVLINVSEDELFELVFKGQWEELEPFVEGFFYKEKDIINSLVNLFVSRVREGSLTAAQMLVKLDHKHAKENLSTDDFDKIIALIFDVKNQGKSILAVASPSPHLESMENIGDKKNNLASIRHKVIYGDSLWAISKRYGVSINEIKRLNHLSSEELKVGDTLLLTVTSP